MAVGIVAEFNPFHNGHKYLLNAAGADGGGVVVVMSGGFVQRGGTAVTDKHTRAEAAAANGADLVLELPAVYSLATAQRFAAGAVATLRATGIIDTLAFGSECGSAAELERAAQILNNEPPEVSAKLRQYLGQGMSYPAARAKAFGGLIAENLLSSPNDILAVEYIRAALASGADWKFRAIRRRGSAHDDALTYGEFASASYLREIICVGGDISDFSPMRDFDIYDGGRLDTAVIANIRVRGAEYLKTVADVTEGLENRIYRAALHTASVKELCLAVKSKRYPLSRIRRIAYASLINITDTDTARKPEYLRVLAMNDTGRGLLRGMKTKAELPIITKPADFSGGAIFNVNRRADDIFALCSPADSSSRDITVSPVVVHGRYEDTK